MSELLLLARMLAVYSPDPGKAGHEQHDGEAVRQGCHLHQWTHGGTHANVHKHEQRRALGSPRTQELQEELPEACGWRILLQDGGLLVCHVCSTDQLSH